MNRMKKHYMMSEKSVEYLDKVKHENDLKYNSEALELIIKEHEKNTNFNLDYVINAIAEKVVTEVKKEVKGLKNGVNSSDKNSQILIELLNGIFFKQKYGLIVTTSEDIAPGIKMAMDEVEKRIITNRNIKLDKSF